MLQSGLHQHLLNDFQRDLPLSPTPYLDMANRLGVSEEAVLAALGELTTDGLISRVGAVFQPNTLGVSTLGALAVPEHRLEQVAAWVSTLPEVNHNYEREHHFNLWFVLTASDSEHLQSVIASIEATTGLDVLFLPLLEEYYIDLGFPLAFGSTHS